MRATAGKFTRRRTAFGLLISVVLTIILLLIVEIVLRINTMRLTAERPPVKGEIEKRPDLLIRYDVHGEKRLVANSHVVIKNHRMSNRDIRIDTNSLGFRSEEIPAKRDGETRVMVLGDSITFGDYMAADEIYLKRAQQYLNDGRTSPSFYFINAGVGDTGTKEQVDLLEETVSRVQPDVVVVAFYLNDSRPPWGFPKELGTPGWLRRNSVLADTIYRDLKLSRWVHEQGEGRFEWIFHLNQLNWRHDPYAFNVLINLAKYDWGSAWYEEAWHLLKPEFDRLQRIAQDRGFRLVLLSFPVAYQVYTSFVDDRPQKRLADEAAQRKFYYLDLLPVLRTHNNVVLFYDHCHPNIEGNEIIGLAVADFFKKEAIGRAP